ncbi:MAG TPA: type II secretion system protein [Coleofasciculaceae cyanobacterium]|jgi:prepilin-type N-terminal cleavage/methylation domain-containing protein
MRTHKLGFTLAELLIALAILGVIATFTIPKVLQSTTSGQNTAVAKEAASMVSGAFTAYQLNNSIADATTPGVFTQYMNYVSTDAATTGIGTAAGQTGLQDCNVANVVCLKLHNGAILQYGATEKFKGTTTTSAVHFNVDPDGTGTGAGRITFVQFINGRMTTGGVADDSATEYSTTAGALTFQTVDPSYLTQWN